MLTTTAVVVRCLRWAWGVILASLALWLVATGMSDLGVGAVTWSLAAAVLAFINARVSRDVAWSRRARWLAFGVPLLGIVLLILPGPIYQIVWFGYLLSVPPKFTRRSLLELLPDTLAVGRTRAPVLAFRAVVVAMAIILNLHRLPGNASAAADPASLAAAAGCYSVGMTSWIPGGMPGHSPRGVLPSLLRLDTLRGPRSPSDSLNSHDVAARRRYQMEQGKHLIRPGWHGAATWSVRSRGSVRLGWGTGFNGANARLVRIGPILFGRVSAFTDVIVGGRPNPSAWIWLRPVDCAQVAREDETLRV